MPADRTVSSPAVGRQGQPSRQADAAPEESAPHRPATDVSHHPTLLGLRASGRGLASAWILTRTVLLTIWLVAWVGFDVPSARGDVAYYYRAISRLAALGPEATMIEYPTPVVALTWLLYQLSGTNATVFVSLFVALMVCVDAAFSWLLWRRTGPARGLAVGFWIAFIFLLGPTVFLRFDLIPAVLSAAALVAVTGARPKAGLAGGLVALATALKLWPAATWPSTWGPDRGSLMRSSLAALSVGGALGAASVLWAGWSRLFSPLTWQNDRGLQIESVFATLPMVVRAMDPSAYVVEMSRYQAFEITGPGTAPWLSVASVASLVGYLVVAVMAIALARKPAQHPVAPVIVMVLAAVILVVANKTFSPQYMLWVGAPLAAGLGRLGLGRTPVKDRVAIRRAATLVLALAAATALIYPIGYRPLIYGLPGVGLVTAVLLVRNLGMLVLAGLLMHWAWHSVIKRRSE